MTDTSKMGPNVKALFAEFWTKLTLDRAGHAGGNFGKVAAVAARMAEGEGEAWKQDAKDAWEQTKDAIHELRSCPGYLTKTDEDIAGEIMQAVQRLMRQRKLTKS